MSLWKNFNDAEEPMSLGIMPKNTLVKAQLTLHPGGHNDEAQGWTDNYATRSRQSNAVYLDCKFTVLVGEYAKRSIWHRIGLYSEKGDVWANMGRTFIKSLLNSARGVQPHDDSPQAKQARTINNFGDLNGLIAIVKIGIEKDNYDNERNSIQAIVTPDHPQYQLLMTCGELLQQSPLAAMAHASWAR